MKLNTIGFWALATLAASVLAVQSVYSQTERFSARLIGAEEVPPINTAWHSRLPDDDPAGDDHL